MCGKHDEMAGQRVDVFARLPVPCHQEAHRHEKHRYL